MAAKTKVEVWGTANCKSTRKAKKFLNEKKVEFAFKDLTDTAPSKALLKDAMKTLETPKKLFNTATPAYRESGYKEKLEAMTKDQIVDALVTNPLLIKRPIVRTDKGLVVGYDETALKKVL